MKLVNVARNIYFLDIKIYISFFGLEIIRNVLTKKT